MPDRYSLPVLLGAGAGLRQGEAFGLALDRIDPVAGMITIDQQVIIVDRRPVLAPPKTSSSIRDVPMPTFVLAAVTAHCGQLGLTGGEVLCRTHRGGLLRRDYFNREIWKPAVATAQLPADTTFHDLRHTFASTALGRRRAYLRGIPLARPQVDHHDRGPVRAPGSRSQRPRPGRPGQGVRRNARVPPMCPRQLLNTASAQVKRLGGG